MPLIPTQPPGPSSSSMKPSSAAKRSRVKIPRKLSVLRTLYKKLVVNPQNTVLRFFRNLARSWAYAKLGWSNYDWDYNYLFAVLRFKLARMEKYITGPQSMATHDVDTKKSLRLAVRLVKKLEEDSYTFFVDRHHEKWKDVRTFEHVEPTPEERQAGIGMISRPIQTPETAIARKEYICAAQADEKIKQRDLRWFFSIVEKYHTRWWD